MQRMSLGTVVVVLLCACAAAQVREAANATVTRVEPVPAEIQRRSESLHAALKPMAAVWVGQQAKIQEQQSTLDMNALEAATRQRFGGSLPAADINAMVFAVLTEATQDQDADLQTMMNEMQAQTQAKQSLRDLLNAINQAIASAGKATGNAKCLTAFCQALPAKLDGIAAETAGMSKPVRLQAPPNLTYAQLAALRSQLGNSLDSMNEMSEMTSMRLQMAMDRRSKFVEALSNLMKSVNDTSSVIISNMK
jgi:hypothetical protein